jgi:TPR repeat protein
MVEGGSEARCVARCPQSGYMYAKGLGTARNVPEAIRHFEAVARPGDSSDAFLARIELARIFASGGGISVDRKVVLDWYSAALAIAPATGFADEVKEAREFVASASL